MIVLVERASRALVIIDPPVDGAGAPIPPEGLACDVVALSASEAAKIGQGNATYTVTTGGVVEVTPVAEVAAPPTIEERIAALEAGTATERSLLTAAICRMAARIEALEGAQATKATT